ncbi:MAG: hypothetical protein ACT4OZ_05085 [Gemmatimonadota bacterium]
MTSTRFHRVALTFTALLLSPGSVAAQQNGASVWSPRDVLASETYVRPPAEIERLVAAPRQNNVSLGNLSPDRKHFLNTQSEGLPSLATFGKAHYYFAGLQVDFGANRARSLTTRGASGLEVIDAATGAKRTLETPRGATVSAPDW